MRHEVKQHLKTVLSQATGSSFIFGDIKFSLPFSLIMSDIEMSSPLDSATIATIKAVKITPDILPIFTEKIFRVRLSISGISAKEVEADISACVDIPKKPTWKETLSAPEISSISLSSGDIIFREYHVSSLFGEVTLDAGTFSAADLLFTFRGEDFMLDFKKGEEKNSFHGRLRSKDYTLKGLLLPETDALIIESLRGSIFSLNTDLKGKIVSLSAPGEREFDIKGRVSGKIDALLNLAFKNDPKVVPRDLGGFFSADFETCFAENNIKDIYLSSDIKVDRISLNNTDFEKISGKVSVFSGILSLSDMTFFLGSNPTSLELAVNIYDNDLPLTFKVSASKMDVKTALAGIQEVKEESYGPVTLDLSFSGSGKKLYSAVSYFIETRTLYPDGNIYADMEMSGRIDLESYRNGTNILNDIFAEFSLKDGVLEASDISFRSMGGYFKGKGGISFFAEDMPVFLDVSIKGTAPSLLPEKLLGKGNSAAGPIEIGLSFKGPGKITSDFLKRSLKDNTGPENPPFQKLWRTALLPEYKNKLKKIDLSLSVKMISLYLSGINFEDIDLNILFKNGVVSSPSSFFRVFKGDFTGKAEVSTSDTYLPLFFELSIKDMDPSAIPGRLLARGDASLGTLDMNISYRASGHFISGMMENKNTRDGKPDEPVIKHIWRKILSAEYRNMFQEAKISFSSHLKTLNIKGALFSNIDLDAEIKDGLLKISDLSLNFGEGTFRGEADILVDHADFPVYLNTYAKNLNLSDISMKLSNSAGISEGPVDMAFSFSGRGKVLKDVSEHIKNLSKKGVVSLSEKFRSSLLFMSEKRLFTGHKAKCSFSFKTLRIGKIKLDNLFGDIFFNEGLVAVPALNGIFYYGVFSSSLEADLNSLGFPFKFNADIKKSDLRTFVKDTLDKKSLVHGNLDFMIKADGKAEYQSSYSGYGELSIYDANLGRVPILAPLLGWIYEGLEDVFPAFKKINIDSAWASFDIKDRKLMTDDLVLSGSDICLIAEGSLDFDGRLDFSFENELIEQKIPEDTDWPVSVRNFITSFGKTISRAKLKGTLKDQKWEFEYLAPIKKAIDSNVKAFFEGLSE